MKRGSNYLANAYPQQRIRLGIIMFYTNRNFKTKKKFKEAVASGMEVHIYAPGLGTPPTNGKTAVGGPHYPSPHTWYAEVTMQDGKVVNVK